MIWHWSTDIEKFKKKNPDLHRVWLKNENEIKKSLDFFSKSKWINSGEIYLQKQKRSFFREAPVLMVLSFKQNIPKYEYVSFGFVLDEVTTSSAISVVDKNKIEENRLPRFLIGGFKLN